MGVSGAARGDRQAQEHAIPKKPTKLTNPISPASLIGREKSGPGRTATRSATARHTHHRAVSGPGALTAPGRSE